MGGQSTGVQSMHMALRMAGGTTRQIEKLAQGVGVGGAQAVCLRTAPACGGVLAPRTRLRRVHPEHPDTPSRNGPKQRANALATTMVKVPPPSRKYGIIKSTIQLAPSS